MTKRTEITVEQAKEMAIDIGIDPDLLDSFIDELVAQANEEPITFLHQTMMPRNYLDILLDSPASITFLETKRAGSSEFLQRTELQALITATMIGSRLGGKEAAADFFEALAGRLRHDPVLQDWIDGIMQEWEIYKTIKADPVPDYPPTE